MSNPYMFDYKSIIKVINNIQIIRSTNMQQKRKYKTHSKTNFLREKQKMIVKITNVKSCY